MRKPGAPALLVGVILLVGSLPGCGEPSDPGTRPAASHKPVARHAVGRADEREGATRSRAEPSKPQVESPSASGRSQTITTSGGVVWRPPRVPRRSTENPGRGCVSVDPAEPPIPPRPGISAAWRKSGVEIRYRFESLPYACRPRFLVVSVDDTTDTLPGDTKRARISGRTGALTVSVRPALRAAELLSAMAMTAGGALSEPAVVQIATHPN
jgi:hypothetical protein